MNGLWTESLLRDWERQHERTLARCWDWVDSRRAQEVSHDERAFASAGVSVRFADYDGYPEYPQLYPPFEHAVSALDLVFCTGPRARDYMKDVASARSAA